MKKIDVQSTLKQVAGYFETQDCEHDMLGALEALRCAAEIEPDNPEIYLWMGRCHAKGLGEPEEGRRWFERAVELKPDYSEAYLELATLDQDDHCQKSLEIYQKRLS